jgi:phage terminase small subunit
LPNAELNPKQQRFVAEYLANGLNATKAYISAGYAPKDAAVSSSQILRNPKVAAAIAASTEKVMEELDYSVKRTLQEVARVAFFDPRKLFEDDGSLKRINEWDDNTAAAIGGVEVTELFEGDGEQKHAYGLLKKVKVVDKGPALDKLMRYHSLYKDKMELTGGITLMHNIPRPNREESPAGGQS